MLFAARKQSLARLFAAYDADLVVCWGFPWKLPAEALAAPRFGVINNHSALLPRHRGPVPIAWTLRAGDDDFGVTWHRMDAEYDTGHVLAQARVPVRDDDTTIEDIDPRLAEAALDLLPGVLDRVRAGDPGDPQPAAGATWAPPFDADYAAIDLARTAREVHNQVRAWALTMGAAFADGPIAEIDGEHVRVLRTSLVPHPGARRVDCADAPIWIVASEFVSDAGSP